MRRCGIYIGPAMAEKLVRHGVTGVKDLVGKAQVGEPIKKIEGKKNHPPAASLNERMSCHGTS